MQEVAEGIHRLGSRYINFYLVEQADKLMLVDTGLPAYWDQLPAALGSLGRSLDDIDAVVLTHSHADHIGNAARLASEHKIRNLIHESDADSAARAEKVSPLRLAPFLWRPWFARYSSHLLRSGATSVPPLVDSTAYSDGEVLDVPGRPRMIHLPGHTAGSCALHLEQRGVLLSGDAIVTLDTLRGRPGPAVFSKPFSEDEGRAYDSLAQLEGVEADITLPGHGEPWTGSVEEAVRIARSKR